MDFKKLLKMFEAEPESPAAPPAPATPSFSQAFASGRKAALAGGNKTFSWTNPKTGKVGTYGTDLKKPAAPAVNPNQSAVDASNKVQADQTAAVATASAKPDAVVDPTPDSAAEPTPAPQANALGISPVANVAGSPTSTASTEKPTPAPQANALGISPVATVPGSPTALGAPKSVEPTNAGPMGNVNAAVKAATAAPVGGGPTSTTGADFERGAVTGGFGQDTNITTDSPDQISKRGPMGITLPEAELEEDDLSEIMRLSGRPMQEKAPPGAKAERMVKHIKKGYAKDGKLSDKEKSIAYATAWKSHNKSKVSEGLSLTEGGGTLDHIKNRFKQEVKNFMAHGYMDSDLYHALYDYYRDTGEIPYSVVKDDPHSWVEERFYMDMGSGMSESNEGILEVAPSTELTELARLAGLSESQVAECGNMGMEQQDSMNVSTNMNTDGTKSVSISAQGGKADALLQMLKMAGMRPHDDHDEGHEEVVMIGNPDEEMMDEGMMDEASSQRLIDKLGDSALGAKVYKDLEWGEYVVKFIKDGKLTSDESWYHTDDLDDAMSTAQKEIQFMQQRGNDEMMEDSGGMQVHDLSRMSGRELYDETQTNDDIHDGDVLMTDSGVGIMVEAWPVIVAGDIQGFHKLADTTWEEFEGGKYLDSYNKAMEVSGSVQEEYANEPEEEYQTVNSIMRQGNDLNREKQQHKHSYRNSDNPMAMELDEELSSLLDSILVREEMTDVLKAEQPYKDEKTGKMVTPPKGATMPPADSPPATKTAAPTVKK